MTTGNIVFGVGVGALTAIMGYSVIDNFWMTMMFMLSFNIIHFVSNMIDKKD